MESSTLLFNVKLSYRYAGLAVIIVKIIVHVWCSTVSLFAVVKVDTIMFTNAVR